MRWTKRCSNCKRFIKYKCKKCNSKISFIKPDNTILFYASAFGFVLFVLLILKIMRLI